MHTIRCAYGCSQGRCRPAASTPKSCTDTDGGKVPDVRGTLTDESGKTYTDECIESGLYAGYVREHFCESTGGHGMSSTRCEYGCEQGRCRAAPTGGGSVLPPNPSCNAGDAEKCNSGLAGICSAGTQSCSSGGAWGTCSALIRRGTVPENCGNGKDDDCDGLQTVTIRTASHPARRASTYRAECASYPALPAHTTRVESACVLPTMQPLGAPASQS